MDKIIMSARAKNWMTKKGNEVFHTAGIYFDGNTALVGWKHGGENFLKTYQMRHRGKEDFYVPISLWGVQYQEGETYEMILCEYLKEMLKRIRKALPAGKLLVIFAMPERNSWIREKEKYLAVLERLSEEIDRNIIPVLFPLSNILDVNKDSRTLLVSVEREWTEITLLKENKQKQYTSVHLGVSPETNMEESICLRMNDYLHNSTEEWDEFRADNCFEAFQTVMKKLYDNGWNSFEKICLICPEKLRKVWEPFLVSQDFQVNWIMDVTLRMVKIMEEEISRKSRKAVPEREKSIVPASVKKQNVREDDIWSL